MQIGRAKGEVTGEDKIRFEAKIAELRKEQEEAVATEKHLNGQCKKVKQELQNALRHQADLGRQVTEIQGRIDELLLQTRSGEEALRKAVREKEEVMVQHDVLKLEVRKLRDALSAKTDEVFGLENRAAQLDMTLEERKREIEAHQALQRASFKLAEEERHKLAVELTDRSAKINLLKTKYEALCARLRGSDGAGEEQKSQAFFILQAAQKREELQREGDELDVNIQRAEKEIRALSSTLDHLNARNTEFRLAFHTVDPSSDEASVVRALEQQAKDAQDSLFKRRRELGALQAQAENNKREASNISERVANLAAQYGQLEAAQAKVAADQHAQQAAVDAALRKVQAARDRHRRTAAAKGRVTSSGASPDELAFYAQGVRESTASVLYTLGQLSREFPQIKTGLTTLMNQYGLRMPARPPTRVVGTSGAASSTAGQTLSLAAFGSAAASSSEPAATPSRSGAGGVAVPASPIVAPTNKATATKQQQQTPQRPGSANSELSIGGRSANARGSTPTGQRKAGSVNAAPRLTNGAAAQPQGLSLGISGRPLSGASSSQR